MKNRASLSLMELLIMVLVFSLAAAVCLRLFVAAGEISEEITRQDEAVVMAQNAAEALKAGKEPEILSQEGLKLAIREVNPEVPGMKQAQISVFYENEVIFSMETGWQEVGG